MLLVTPFALTGLKGLVYVSVEAEGGPVRSVLWLVEEVLPLKVGREADCQ